MPGVDKVSAFCCAFVRAADTARKALIMPRSKQTKTQSATVADFNIRPCNLIAVHVTLCDAIDWIEGTRLQIHALSKLMPVLTREHSNPDTERTIKGIESLFGSIDAQLLESIGYIH